MTHTDSPRPISMIVSRPVDARSPSVSEPPSARRADAASPCSLLPPSTQSWPAPAEDTLVRRQVRLEHKMSLAATLMRDLPLDDRRALLLRSALLRRDEVLLDAILADLGSARPARRAG